jgi:hypothetical protein
MPELKFHLLKKERVEKRREKRDHETGKCGTRATATGKKNQEGPTFQEAHCAVEALRTEFVVSEGAQQFTDNNVRRFRKYEGPHVAKQNADLLPPFGSLSLLQTERRGSRVR